MTNSAVSVRGLTKDYGPVKAVRGIDLDVAEREMFGFLGPNGAGKTTAIKIMCTLAEATSGSVSVAGCDVATQRTHYMDEAEYCDRIAIMNKGEIVVTDTPEALKSSVGSDRVQIRTDDDELAIARLRERFAVEAAVHEGMVTFAVPGGAEFVPRLFAELGVTISTVTVKRPSLDDVFMAYTGRTIQDTEAESMTATFMRAFSGRR